MLNGQSNGQYTLHMICICVCVGKDFVKIKREPKGSMEVKRLKILKREKNNRNTISQAN